MYLCDRDLRALLPDVQIEVEPGAEPFDADAQVQPATIDFRLSSVFWRPRRRFTVDLRRAKLLEIAPRRYYRRVALREGETITLKPGGLLLGRTLERFSIPNGHAGELVGRSSFARLGLMVTAAGGFINPGWRGRMPLQLVNFSPNPIKLVAGLPVCQVRFVKLTGQAERPYGSPGLGSIYSDDDGGPSYWWRDKRIQALHRRLSDRSVSDDIQRRIYEIIGNREPEVIERLDRYVDKVRATDLQHASALLDAFSKREDRRRSWRRAALYSARGAFGVSIATALWVYTRKDQPPFAWWQYGTWALDLLGFALSIYAFTADEGDHFGSQELATATRETGASS